LIAKKGQFRTVLEAAKNVIAYISENYRIENRVIRNRRVNLTIDLPHRELYDSFSYDPSNEENDVIEDFLTISINMFENGLISKLQLSMPLVALLHASVVPTLCHDC